MVVSLVDLVVGVTEACGDNADQNFVAERDRGRDLFEFVILVELETPLAAHTTWLEH
jgi:hypothetical protein